MHEDAGDSGHKTPGPAPGQQIHPMPPCHGQSGSRHTETASHISAHLSEIHCILRLPARSGDLIKIYLFKARKVNFLFPVCFITSYIIFLSYSSVRNTCCGGDWGLCSMTLFPGGVSHSSCSNRWLSVDFHIICPSFPSMLTSIDETCCTNQIAVQMTEEPGRLQYRIR